MTFDRPIAKLFSENRKANKMKQAELARELDVSPQLISIIESGRTNANYRHVFKLAELFKLDPKIIAETILHSSAEWVEYCDTIEKIG